MYKKKDRVLDSFTKTLKKKYGKNIKKIILFGSRARGDNNKYSDYDLLVIYRKKVPGMERYIEELENNILINEYDFFSTYIISESEFQKRLYEPYLMNIKKEGIAV